MKRRFLASLALLALAACGDLPQPFRGNPGGMAGRLAVPPPYRLVVPPPEAAMLTTTESEAFAKAVAEALLKREVPAVADAPLPLDWRLKIDMRLEGNRVVPRYALFDPDGAPQGVAEGSAIPARDWARPNAALFAEVANDASRRAADLLLRAEAARKSTNPAALAAAGPPRLYLLPVRGAPGDGNQSLTARMRDSLGDYGILAQDVADGAGFAADGRVDVVPTRPRMQRVEILWIISRRDGQELGRVLQMNEIPAGLLDRHWGDIAFAAAAEAAGGVQRVIENAGGMPARDASGQRAQQPNAAPGGLALPPRAAELPRPEPAR
ncbi:MAG: hypothetical protein ING26_01615 [Roseomonas sp.]|nr:hypothetical protein [Roseomonas sp.]MCA3299545.1 hypothetical protein [Roseomonas sp.]